MAAYYNEFDHYAAQWLRELIKKGIIADGEVDERSIVDVRPDELRGFTQCHFFAGIGVWSHALRQAGWSDDAPVWTGSYPCQPFSSAGSGKGFTDERHLWPHFHWLISQCRPAIVLGEQVASKDGLAWLDLVQADLEGAGYTSGAVDTCAAGFGAPHIRQRLYWVAYPDNAGLQGRGRPIKKHDPQGRQEPDGYGSKTCIHDGMADAKREKCEERISGRGKGDCAEGSRPPVEPTGLCLSDGLADANGNGSLDGINASNGRATATGAQRGRAMHPSLTNGFWRDADWLFCRDGKWRSVEPGTSPLAHGTAARVGRLRGYGNAIVAPQATAFIEAVMEMRP